ncbi:hypothetical protein [Providencia stuartii]|uniref:hypothetical protein n=1 Tax=Providencia stuartii TaxID=588 RepID=UPI001495358F|nr:MULTISPECIES: hypothetical protein [Providencia]MDF4176460.1 hypothetical protein [Providencia thailandensis]MDT2041064.1 hypothetical protein [Providencia stuartii]NPD43811.1 hypothetical protein [Providencia stuartii]NPD97112.1 hypothetical protein [Providencia stuartii]WIJ75415.1 hypothetical protein OI982_08115 [Providencia thailandensis]
MSRNDLIDRVIYSHYLEQLYSTALGRVDKLISILIFIFGSAIVLQANTFVFGVLIAALTAIQSTCQFGKKSGEAKRKAFDYQKLFTIESKYDDSDLVDRILEIEASDSTPWSSLSPIATLKAQIKMGVDEQHLEKLTTKSKLLRLLCG